MFKKTQLVILTAIVIVTLFAAVLPALAISSEFEIYNLRFMGDKNGDNVPDKWNVKGDVVRNCDHPYYPPALSPCAMIFLPSNSGAALWQRLDLTTDYWSWVVVEEGVQTAFGGGYVAAKQMDWYRAYFGTRLIYDDGTKITFYDYVDGGTYNFDEQLFWAVITNDFEQEFEDGLVKYYDYGIVTLPHGGYLAIDQLLPWILD